MDMKRHFGLIHRGKSIGIHSGCVVLISSSPVCPCHGVKSADRVVASMGSDAIMSDQKWGLQDMGWTINICVVKGVGKNPFASVNLLIYSLKSGFHLIKHTAR